MKTVIRRPTDNVGAELYGGERLTMMVDNFGEIKRLSEKHGNTRAILERIDVIDEYDDRADVSYLADSADEYPENGDHLQRLEAYHNGDWHCIGVVAVATIYIPCGGGSFKVQTISSAGLWGVESDSDASYLEDVAAGECYGLVRMLGVLNVDTSLVVIPGGVLDGAATLRYYRYGRPTLSRRAGDVK